MKNTRPPLENSSSNPLDENMSENAGANVAPEMSGSLGKPKPNMRKGYSAGSIDMSEELFDEDVKRDPFDETGYYDDDY